MIVKTKIMAFYQNIYRSYQNEILGLNVKVGFYISKMFIIIRVRVKFEGFNYFIFLRLRKRHVISNKIKSLLKHTYAEHTGFSLLIILCFFFKQMSFLTEG